MRPVLAFVLAILAACGPEIPTGPEKPYSPGLIPSAPRLGAALPAGHTRYDNASLADLVVTLTHDLEWGATRPALIRYGGPVRVGVVGDGARPYLPFLERFLEQLRHNTGIDVGLSDQRPNLVIRFVRGQEFRKEVPQHFCVVAPGPITWIRFRQSPVRYGTRAYETQRSMQGMTIFIPDNAAPYIVRTCLIEELVQALGPVNDLYGLGPSIFNDDAAHIWPTRLDYMVLRVLYAPEVQPGMSRAETRVAALAALNRLNPEGIGAPPLPLTPPSRMQDWIGAIRDAFNRGRSRAARTSSAERAVELAAKLHPDTALHCRALGALIRIGRPEARRILPDVNDADAVCARAHGANDIRVARVQLDLARLHYDTGNPAVALAMTDELDTKLAAHGQDERLTALYALRAAALRALQQETESLKARRLAGDWGAYALGTDHPDVRRWRGQ